MLLLPLLGCGAAQPPPATATPKSTPTITLLSPTDGAVIRGDFIQVTVAVTGLTMDADAIGKAKVEGRGHWHFYLDGNFIHSSALESLDANQIPPGEHHIRVSLHNNDHSPLSPPAEASAVVEVVAN